MHTIDECYGRIASSVDYSNPQQHVDELRVLADCGHADAMNLLAILLGDIDDVKYRDEIVSLYKRATELGSAVAEANLHISIAKWKEGEGG